MVPYGFLNVLILKLVHFPSDNADTTVFLRLMNEPRIVHVIPKFNGFSLNFGNAPNKCLHVLSSSDASARYCHV